MNLALLILGGGGLFLIGLFNWRRAVFGAMLLVVFEGAIRKWVLPQASQMVYFAKDFLLLGAYFSYFFVDSRKRSTGFSEGLSLLLLLAVTWAFFESFNFGTGSTAAGLFGWKAYVMYVPLCFMVPDLFRSEAELAQYLRCYLAIALPVCILGVAQFSAGADSRLNVYAAGADPSESGTIAVFGEDALVRITGTFSYISGYGTYLDVSLALLLPILAWSQSKNWRLVLGCTLALVIANATMTGSRAVALGAGLILAGYIGLSFVTGGRSGRSHTWVNMLAVGLAVVSLLFFYARAVTALEQRTENSIESGEAKTRFWAPVLEPLDFLDDAGFLGHGSGIAQPAVGALQKTLHLPPPSYYFASPTDTENTRVLMELGIPGFLLWYGMRLGLVFALWRTRNRLRSPFLKELALGAWMVLLYQLFNITTFNATANVYHWFLAGFILLLPRLDAQSIPGQAANRTKRGRNRWFGRVGARLQDAAAPAIPSQEVNIDGARMKNDWHQPGPVQPSGTNLKSSA
jgi:hypothetical protein